jgi:hypothetical protein
MPRRARRRPVPLVLLLAVLAATLLAAGPASATLTRARTLGGDLNYFEDDAGVTAWYGALLDYPDQAVLDLGDYDHDGEGAWNQRTSGTAGAFHAILDAGGRWGVAAYLQEDLPAGAPGGGATLIGAHRLGRVDLALRAQFTSYFEGANSTEVDGFGQSLYFHGYGLGLRWDLSDRVYADLAGDLVNVQGDDTDQDLWSLPPQQTWSTWTARARCFVAVGEHSVLVPVLDHRQDDRQVVAEVIGAPADQHARLTAAGLGFNLLPDPDNLIVVSAEYRWGHERHERLRGDSTVWDYDASELEYNEVHARVGVESRVLPWLTLRGAISYLRLQQELLATRVETSAGEPDRWLEEKSIEVLTPVTLGFALHLGSFQADVLLNARRSETYGTVPFGPTPAADGTYTAITLGYSF